MGTIDAEFLTLMPARVTWARFTGTDAVGNNTYATGLSLQSRLEPITQTMNVTVAESGATVARVGTSLRVITDMTTPAIQAKDKITLPDGSEVRVVSAITYWDESGPYYQEANCENNQES